MQDPDPAPRTHFLRLNHDVLTAISAFCDPADALQLAMTCKDAYTIAFPRVLADVSFGDPRDEEDGPDRLKMFCRSMLDYDHQMPHLKALRLLEGAFACSSNAGSRGGWGADFSSADLLTELLLKADSLRVVHIRDAEPLFQSHPSVYEALAKLPRLRELSLYYIGNSTLKAMSQLTSRPAIIENGLWKDGPRPQGDITPLGPYVDSLRHLKLWECGCMLESVIDRHIWPNVHTLDIGGRIAKISELAHVFPNLRRLTFFLEFSIKQETGTAAPCWPELDYLETSAPLPSFPSPARRLQLQYPMGAKSGTQNDLKTLPLMEKTNPVVLSCTIAQSLPRTMIERMKAATPALRYVELMLTDGSYGRSMAPQDVLQWVRHHQDIIRTSPLKAFCIAYAGSCSGPAAKWLKARRPELEDIALLLARSVKTLEYVGVGVQASAEQTSAEMYTCNCMWFRVVGRPAFTGSGQEGEPMLEPVPAADAEALRERLQAMPRE